MMTTMRPTLLKLLLPAVLAMSALPVQAANGPPEEDEPFDARLAGFASEGGVAPIVIKPASGTAGTWFLTVGLGVLCFGVMCKNGNRTHMD